LKKLIAAEIILGRGLVLGKKLAGTSRTKSIAEDLRQFEELWSGSKKAAR
jgi:hypothetical protein